MSMSNPLLTVTGLGRSFATRGADAQQRWVIKDLAFSIDEGEFVTVIGPSGSGKSTLLNLLSQVDLPSAGEIWLDGERVSHEAVPSSRPGLGCRIGYVTQDDNLLPWRTLLDNVLFPLQLQGRLDAVGRQRARELLDAVGLSGFEKHYPHELSGGMRKRASVIRTLVYDPPIILMDEPFGALDAQTRLQLQNDLLALWTARRKTILFVTHDIGEAIGLADRVLVLSKAPTRIESEHVVDLPRPRRLDALLVEPGYAELHERIRAQVR